MAAVEKQSDVVSIVPEAGMSELEDCVSALVVLGYPAADANKAARKVYEEGASVEQMIRNALRILAK